MYLSNQLQKYCQGRLAGTIKSAYFTGSAFMPVQPSHTPLYIALEGLDGTGKSTLFNNLVARLQQEGIPHTTLCPTRMTRPRSIIERLYNFSPRHKKIRFLRRIIFAYRSWCASRLVDKNSKLILGDRSIAGSYAKNWKIIFHSAKLTIGFFNMIEPFVPAPHHILLLQAPPLVIAERLAPRAYVDVDEVPHVQERMDAAYRQMMAGYPIERLKHTQWTIIDAAQPEQQLTDEVFNLIQELIARHSQQV